MGFPGLAKSAPVPPAQPLASWRDAGGGSALLVLVVALGVVVLRPALPIDETAYLEVFRESQKGGALLLRLAGAPYAEKPPLLFWIARALTWLWIPSEFALRCVPALATALTVFFTARIGARAGLRLSGWLQAALLFPLLAGQFLGFDALMAAAIWGAIDAWVRRRDGAVTLWIAAALLAKGPVAFLFLIPSLWSTAPLRAPSPGAGKRAALLLALALIPLAAWALSAAALGGPEFANALLWDRWAGRVGSEAHHARPMYFYLPIVLVGALPATAVLFLRQQRAKPEWTVRLGPALLFVLVAFSLIHGKQAHYLVPMAPALALLLAWRIESGAREFAWLRHGVRLQLALLLACAVVGALLIPGQLHEFSMQGRELVESGAFLVPLVFAGVLALAGLAFTLRKEPSAQALLLVALVSSGASLLPLHWMAGKLLFPSVLAGALENPPSDLAYLGTTQHALYNLLARRAEIEQLKDESELAPWGARHPGGLLLVDEEKLHHGPPETLVLEGRETAHRNHVLLLRAPPAPSEREGAAPGRP